MAILTLYCSNPMQSGSSAGLLNTSAPGASTSTTGWTVGNVASPSYCSQQYNTEKTSGTFVATACPSGSPVSMGRDCWRTSATTTGTFSGGTWYSSVSVIAVTSGGDQDGNARFRLYRSSSNSMLNPTQLTAGTMVGTTVTNLSTTVAQSSSASTFIAGFSVTNEYLVLQVAWQRTGAGGSSTRDVLIRFGSMAQTDGSGVITTDFTVGGGGTAPKAGYYSDYYQRVVSD